MSKTLLAVLAHPDDEAFGLGGTLAHAAASGHRVYLICATKGEAGKITHPDIPQDADRAKLREAELRAACDALNIEPPIFLGYHDSGRHERTRFDDPKALMNIDELALETALLPHLERLQPEVMITFDPHGIYGHIDHIKMHRAATAAFWSAGKVMAEAPKRLFYAAMASEQLRRMQTLRENSPLAQLEPGIYGVSEDSFAYVRDVSDYRAQKQAAIEAHKSQTGPQSSFAAQDGQNEDAFWDEMFGLETLTLGGLRGGFPDAPVDDLFTGL